MLSVLLVIATEVSAEIYKYVDEKGILHFTDIPPVKGKYEKMKLYGNIPLEVSAKKKNKGKYSQFQLNSDRLPYVEHIQEVAQKYNLNPDLVKAIIKVESNYNPNAISPKGAQGLMQLMPGTAKRFGVNNPFDPQENIVGGVKYLRFLYDLFQGDLELVLAGYNAGEQRVIEHKNRIPPIVETQQYVERVLNLSGLSSLTFKFSEPIYRYVDKNGVLIFTNIPKIR